MPQLHHDALFRALADPTRREILGLLKARERPVGEIASNFTASRPAISKHLRLLRQAGLVHTERRGTTRICRLDPRPLHQVSNWVREYEPLWRANLRGLKTYIESGSREEP